MRHHQSSGRAPKRDHLAYGQYQELTYWLFKRRLKTSDPARVASDTRKGLQMLERLRGEKGQKTSG